MRKIIQTVLLTFYILVASGCAEQSDAELTMYKWNTRESYYLKMSYSDTIYLVNVYPNEKGKFYAVVSEDERQRLDKLLRSLELPNVQNAHPKESADDGITYAFSLLKNDKVSSYRMHGLNSENPYWSFAEYIDEIKKESRFFPFSGEIKINKMEEISAPPQQMSSNGR